MAGAEQLVEGVLPIDKPAGPTSHDMVARARRALGTRRIGHTGTLDPFASGLLLLCIGRATRIAEYLSGTDKRYSAVVRLGVSTDTADATGAITAERDAGNITQDAVEQALQAQRGTIMQTPPAYSAKKVGGERSYALARQGREVTLEPVRVTIRELTIAHFAQQELHLDVLCSSGTYIRAIARDLGDALGVGAHLSALRRTAVGPHTVERAVNAATLEAAARGSGVTRYSARARDDDRAGAADPDGADPADILRAALIPTLDALPALPRIELSQTEVAHIRHGRAVPCDTDLSGVVVLAAQDDLIAIADAGDGVIRPRKVFL